MYDSLTARVRHVNRVCQQVWEPLALDLEPAAQGTAAATICTNDAAAQK